MSTPKSKALKKVIAKIGISHGHPVIQGHDGKKHVYVGHTKENAIRRWRDETGNKRTKLQEHRFKSAKASLPEHDFSKQPYWNN